MVEKLRACVDCQTENYSRRTACYCDTCFVACCTSCVSLNSMGRYTCTWCVREEPRPNVLKKEDFMATRKVSITLEVVDSPEMTDSKVMSIMSEALATACKGPSIINGSYKTGNISEYYDSEEDYDGIYCG